MGEKLIETAVDGLPLRLREWKGLRELIGRSDDDGGLASAFSGRAKPYPGL